MPTACHILISHNARICMYGRVHGDPGVRVPDPSLGVFYLYGFYNRSLTTSLSLSSLVSSVSRYLIVIGTHTAYDLEHGSSSCELR